MQDKILIIDFGSQVTQLIARRVREMNTYCEIHPFNNLPEITDDVIRLLANSNEALQDFAYIRTQGDVSKFNTKYGVTLVLPAQTA